MEEIKKEYLNTRYDLPHFVQKTPESIAKYLTAFKIDTFKNNGKVCIKAYDLPHFQNCVKFLDRSGMKLKAIEKLSEMRLRQLMKEI